MRRNTESLSLDRLTVAELKKQLTAKGISDLSGRKADLIARLTKDGSDDDDKIAPSPVETPVKTPVKSGGKGAGLGRQLRAASWLLNLVIATAICIGCIYVGGNSVLVSRQDSIDNINFLKLQAQEDEAIIENMGNEKIELLAKLKEVRQQYDYLEEIYERLRDKSKKASQKEGTNYETDFESRDDTQKAKEGSEWDDKDDSMYCYIDSVFGMYFFTLPGECKQQTHKCPFSDVQAALRALKMHPRFIALQQSDRGSNERKKLIKELSIAFHPDKLRQMGCEMEFGQQAMVLLNDFR